MDVHGHLYVFKSELFPLKSAKMFGNRLILFSNHSGRQEKIDFALNVFLVSKHLFWFYSSGKNSTKMLSNLSSDLQQV